VAAAPPLFVVLTGPSGAGKDSILDELKKLTGRPYSFAITVTTRAPRPAERDGVDYYFVSKAEFEELVESGQMLEHAIVYGQEKGLRKDTVRDLLQSGRDVLMRTDVQGARYIKSVVPGAVTIFVAPPSDAELEKRMRARGGDTDEQVAVRLQTARKEMSEANEFDYTIINHDLVEAAAEIERIMAEERSRPNRKRVEIA
jgi:guanylate kinase